VPPPVGGHGGLAVGNDADDLRSELVRKISHHLQFVLNTAQIYDQAAELLDEMLNLAQVKDVEDWEKMKRISDYYQYPAGLRERDGGKSH
jgi:hypothetical protein